MQDTPSALPKPMTSQLIATSVKPMRDHNFGRQELPPLQSQRITKLALVVSSEGSRGFNVLTMPKMIKVSLRV